MDQDQNLRDDRNQHPLEVEDVEINGIPCRIRWNYMIRFYCAYILIERDLTESECPKPHGGWSWLNGFDCGHLGDYPVDLQGTFKTRDFVMDELTRVVSWIINNPE